MALEFHFHDMSLDPRSAVSDHESDEELSIVGFNKYDTDDDEKGAVNDEAEPLRRLEQDPTAPYRHGIGNGELLLQGKHTDC